MSYTYNRFLSTSVYGTFNNKALTDPTGTTTILQPSASFDGNVTINNNKSLTTNSIVYNGNELSYYFNSENGGGFNVIIGECASNWTSGKSFSFGSSVNSNNVIFLPVSSLMYLGISSSSAVSSTCSFTLYLNGSLAGTFNITSGNTQSFTTLTTPISIASGETMYFTCGSTGSSTGTSFRVSLIFSSTGIIGPVGPSPSFSIGTVTSLSSSSTPTVTLTGTTSNPILSFGIPAGVTQDLSSYITSSALTTALANYETTSALTTLLAGYTTSSALATALASYLTSSNASSTYLTISSASSTYAALAQSNTFTGNVTFNVPAQVHINCASYALTPASGDNSTNICTTAFVANALSSYLTSSSASSTYLTQSNASSTYLTISSASGTYATQSAMGAYCLSSYAGSTYATIASLANYATTSVLAAYLQNSTASSTYAPLVSPSFTGNLSITNSTDSTFTIYSYAGGSGNYAKINLLTWNGRSFSNPPVSIYALDANNSSSDLHFATAPGGSISSGVYYPAVDRLIIASDGSITYSVSLNGISPTVFNYLSNVTSDIQSQFNTINSNLSSGYLTNSTASATYLTISNASSTYLTQSNASSTYLTQSNASSTYLTQSNASSTYATISSLSNYETTANLTTALANYITATSLTSTLSAYALSSALSAYETTSALTTTLSGYVTSSSLTTTLGSYVLTSALSAYETTSALTTTLSNYVTNSSLTSTLASYVTSSSLTTTLSSYVTSSSLTTTLGSYVTSSSLTTQLSSYATSASLSAYETTSALTTTLASYVTTSSLTTTLASYVTSSSLTSTLGSYMPSSTAYSTFLTYSNAAVTYATLSDLNNYYTATYMNTLLTNYLTTANASSTYATISNLSSYALASSLSAYETTSALTTTLASYVTSSSLTTTLAGYASLSSNNTFTNNQNIVTSSNPHLTIGSVGGTGSNSIINLNPWNGRASIATTIYAVDNGNYSADLHFGTASSGVGQPASTDRMIISADGVLTLPGCSNISLDGSGNLNLGGGNLTNNNITCYGLTCTGLIVNSQTFNSYNPIVDITSTQTISGNKTFSGTVTIGSYNIGQYSLISSSSQTTLSTPLFEFYILDYANVGNTITITLPQITSSLYGKKVTIMKNSNTGSTASAVFAQVVHAIPYSGDSMITTSSVPATASYMAMSNLSLSMTLMVGKISGTGTGTIGWIQV